MFTLDTILYILLFEYLMGIEAVASMPIRYSPRLCFPKEIDISPISCVLHCLVFYAVGMVEERLATEWSKKEKLSLMGL